MPEAWSGESVTFNLKTAVETPDICKPINLNEFNCSAVEGFGEKPFLNKVLQLRKSP